MVTSDAGDVMRPQSPFTRVCKLNVIADGLFYLPLNDDVMVCEEETQECKVVFTYDDMVEDVNDLDKGAEEI
ncbi:hypothetical protein NDU88_003888 [Pleurodeles waltl]|uniref:Uncharacterized protein n=1 Tax=Pleurodeles waltl TaxID=8319 RepID=A0AAV7QBC4_PLEWA|nr:hypothetical protein NDU88_003888 [Pleurodeles waltl]